jgi:hypothetical protein
VEGYIEDVNKLSVVDCLLPGQLRKLGSQATYLSARRPIRTTEADCEVRGGEYVAYDRANYASALKVWQSKAEEGDATAQLYVGQIYEKGLGQPPDYQKAAQWYRKAAAQGNAQAQVNLGALYEKGLGVSKSSAAAAEWYGKASGLDVAGIQFASAVSAQETLPAQIQPQAQPSMVAQREELEALRQSAERSRREAEQLRLQLAAAESQAGESQTLVRGIKSSKQMELDELRRSAERSQREAEQLRAQLEAARREGDERVQQATERGEREKAALREQLGSSQQQDTEGLRLAAEQSRREAQELRAQLDATRQALLDRQGELRDSQEALDKLRDQLAQQKVATPAADDPRVRELEAELRRKEAALKSQQASVNKMAASFDRERSKMKKDLVAVKEQKAKSAAAPQAAASPAQASPAREKLAEAENALNAQMEAYQKGSSELTALLTGKGGAGPDRAEIDRRKAELQAQAKEISAQKEKVERLAAQATEQGQSEALAQAGPGIEIIDPPVTVTRGVRVIQVGSGAKDIVGKIRAPDDLKSLIINDKQVSPDATGVFRFPAAAQAAGTAVKISATDKQNRTSRLELSLVAASPEAAGTEATAAGSDRAEVRGDVNFGRFYALIIGNNSYNSYPTLQTPVNDAKSLEVVLRERYGYSTRLLVNATRYQIMTALNEIHKKLTPEDNLLIYYAGHGEIDKGTQMAYWLPTDAEAGNPANWISSQSITEFISIMPARHVMVVADSCYSGALTGSAIAKLPDGMDESKREKWLKVMASRKARTVLTSGGVQPVLDQGGGGHSVFANAFLGVLRSNKRVLEDYDVFRSVAGQVKTSASKAGFQQSPQYAPLQHAGHEGSPFFFVPESA